MFTIHIHNGTPVVAPVEFMENLSENGATWFFNNIYYHDGHKEGILTMPNGERYCLEYRQ